MADHIKIRPSKGTWVVRAAGAVLGESTNALELTEGDYPPVIYFPRADLAMAFFEPPQMTSTCPYQGDTKYYTIVAKSGPIPNAACSYEKPLDAVSAIKGHLAFFHEKVAVEQV